MRTLVVRARDTAGSALMVRLHIEHAEPFQMAPRDLNHGTVTERSPTKGPLNRRRP